MNEFVPTFNSQACVSEVLTELADPVATQHLVTIHGIADTSDVWQPVCKALKYRFRSYRQLSMKWHAGVGERYDYPESSALLQKGWRELPAGPKVVLAHSFGSNAFMRMMQEERLDDVAAVVMLSPYYKPDHSAFTWPLFISYVNEFDRFLNMSIDARRPKGLLSNSARNVILKQLRQNYSPLSWVTFFKAWSQTPSLDLSRFDMPCAIVTGSEDFSLPVRDVAALAERIPNAYFKVLQGLGHFALIEDAVRTSNLISNFLKERLYQ